MKKKHLFVFLFLISTFATAQEPKTASTFLSKDGLPLSMKFQPSVNGKPVVIMLHGLASSKEEWIPFEEKLKKEGWGYLAYDARGQGASSRTQDASGHPNEYQTFGQPGLGSPWEKMVGDVGSAIQFIRTQLGDKISVILAGASVGANVALIYASQHSHVKSVLLLSPGLNYQQFLTEYPMQQIKVPVLLVASANDSYAHDSCVILKSKSTGATFWDDVKSGHGVQMFDEQLLSRIFIWIAKNK